MTFRQGSYTPLRRLRVYFLWTCRSPPASLKMRKLDKFQICYGGICCEKIISIVLFLLLALSLTCCGKQNEAPEDTQALTASKWFDSLNGDEMIWDGVREIQLDEFPGVTFRWHPEKLEAVTDREIIPLYTGMPIWSVYFAT